MLVDAITTQFAFMSANLPQPSVIDSYLTVIIDLKTLLFFYLLSRK